MWEEPVVLFLHTIQLAVLVNLEREKIQNLNYSYSELCAEFPTYLQMGI